MYKQSVVNGTIILSSEPLHGLILWDSVLGSNSGFASSSQTDSASWSLQNHVEVHTENTSEWIILYTQINVFLNTEPEVSSIRKICFSKLSVLNFKSSLQNLISLVTSDCNMHCNFLVSFNVETSYCKSCSWWNRFLSC